VSSFLPACGLADPAQLHIQHYAQGRQLYHREVDEMRKNKGLSLVEILMTLGLLGVLMSIALPEMDAWIQASRADMRMRTLAAQIALARSTAVTLQLGVTLCPSADQQQCGGNWTQGSLIFTDRNSDRRLNQDDILVRINGPLAPGETLVWRAFQNRQFLQVEPSGFLRHQSGNFTWCPASRKTVHARQLIINATGRTRLASDINGDGVQEDSSGNPLRCP